MPRTPYALILYGALLAALLAAGSVQAAPPAPDAIDPGAQPAIAAPAAEGVGELGGSCAAEDPLATGDLEGATKAPALGGQEPIGQACYFVRYECQTCTYGVKGCNVYKCWVGPDSYYSYSCSSCRSYC